MPVRIGHVHIYNKDGSTLIGSLNGDSTFNITSEGVTANMYSQTVSFSNSNVIGYAETPNVTTPDYPIGSNDINIGDGISDTSIYEVEADKYTINATKSKITINCQDKTMEKDIIVRFTKTPTQTKTSEFNPGSANSITITPDQGYVLSSVQVNKPATMIPSNIKSGVNIGGVVGTYEAGGGYPSFTTALNVNTFEVYTGEVLLEYLINNDEVKNGWQTIDAIGTIELPDVYAIKFRIHATDNTGHSTLLLSINNGTTDLVNIMQPAVEDVSLETVNFAILEDTTLTIDVNLG